MQSKLLVLGVAAMLPGGVALQSAKPVELYVAPTGDDSWSGTRPAPHDGDGPFATLKRARDELRKRKQAGQLTRGATIYVRGGTYELHETLQLSAEDSGTAEHPLLIREYENEQSVLVGSRAVNDFRPWRGEVLRCDLRGTALEGIAFKQLFYRGERMIMARYPNKDPRDPHFGEWAYVLAVDSPNVKDHFTCTEDVIKNWSQVEQAEICIHPAYGWAWNIVKVKSVDRDTARINLAQNVSYDLRVGDRYFVQNLLEELDTPGEWYLDRETWNLYFWPPGEVGEGDVQVPVTGTILLLEGASHVIVRGFTIEACDGDAVRLQDCQNCVIAKNIIRNCGGWGIAIGGGRACGAIGNDIYYTGAGGVSLNGGKWDTLERGDNFATNNYIHHIAEFRRTYNTGVNINGVGNTASHNLIHDCYHQGILMGGNDNIVEYNIVHHTNLGSEDTGGLYMSSRNYTRRGNIIRYNIFHHVGGFGKANSWNPVQDGRVKFQYPHFTWGIYLDAPESGVYVYGNLLYSVPICGMFNHSGKDNCWENNIVVDAPAFRASVWPQEDLFETSWKPLREARERGWIGLERYPELSRYTENEPRKNTMFNCRFVRNIIYYTEEGSKWLRDRNQSAWDGGQLVWTYSGHQDDFGEFEFDGNVIYAPPGIEPKFELTLSPHSGKLLTWDEWRATGKDAHSVFQDPLFVDPANHDYRLKPESPALKLGFQPIPFDKIGPYADELRASWPIVEAPGAAALGDFTTERYFQLPGYEPVEARELTPRQGLPRFFSKLKRNEPVTIACFAGGNHAQGGWFDTFITTLRQEYPAAQITPLLASIHGGARGSRFSVFRFKHEVLRHNPDLIFIDFASDDAETSQENAWSAIEGVVRQAWQTDPRIDFAFVYAFRLGYETAYAAGVCPSAVSAHEQIAAHYGIPSINLGYRVAAMAKNGELSLKATREAAADLGQPVFSCDGVYTSPDGNQLYAEIVINNLRQLAEQDTSDPLRERMAALAQPFSPGHLERATQIEIQPQMLEGQWESQPPGAWAPHFPQIWYTHTPGAKLTFRFQGTEASLLCLIGPDTGRMRITIDGKGWGEKQLVDRWCYYQRIAALPLGTGLEDTKHTVTVELLPDPPDRSEPIEEAKRLGQYDASSFKGVALRLGWIQIVGEATD
ncbi:MAG: right-handed parallel beta-helix repeat-containing protein [Candidatus Zipacnadales bacterium]